MTDKQIIIDGVDVSGCLFYQANFEEDYDVKIKHYCSNWHNSCESNNNSNCYYKNWQRKEQECERLKKDNKELQYQLRCTTGREINAELKAEQNIIKAVCENHFDEYEMGCLNLSEAIESLLERYDNAITRLMKDRKELKAENEELKNFHINLVGVKECEIRELVKLKQALTEIKQLLEDALDTDKTNAEQSFDNFYKAIELCKVVEE